MEVVLEFAVIVFGRGEGLGECLEAVLDMDIVVNISVAVVNVVFAVE